MHLTRVDPGELPNRPFLLPDDECLYLRDFTVRMGFAYSETNQLIANLKKGPSLRGLPQYAYKVSAIQQCANELRIALGLPGAAANLSLWTLVPMPPSKARGHPDYDDRMELILRDVVAGCPELEVSGLLQQRVSMPAAHESSSRPTVEHLVDAYEVLQTATPPQRIVLFDDVLTQGAHFRAAKTVLQRALGSIPVAGIFIARAVRVADPIDEVLGGDRP